MSADGEGEFKETRAQVAWLLLALKRGFLAGFFKAHSWTGTGGASGQPQRHKHTHTNLWARAS